MKYAFMSFSCPESSLDELIATAKKFGYDAIELRIDANHRHGVEVKTDAATRRQIKEKMLYSGIELCGLATSSRYSDPETRDEMIQATYDAIDLASDTGCKYIRVFGGAFPENISRDQAIDAVADSLNKLAPHAVERGVVICMETHDAWCDPEHVAAVMKKVNSSAVAVNWDIMHPVRTAGKTIDEAFEVLKPWIRYCHFHDGIWEDELPRKISFRPISQGLVDHQRVLELLAGIGYEGFVSGEWIKRDEPFEHYLPRELATLKKIEQNINKTKL